MNDPAPGWLRWLGDWRTVWVLTFAFLVVGVEAVFSGRLIHAAGLWTWRAPGVMADAPLPALFFRHLRPPVALLHLPLAGLGYRAFCLVHLTLAATAIPALAAVARRLGQPLFVLPALVLATSPALSIAAAGGHYHADLVAGLSLALYLLVVRRRGALAGLCLAACVLTTWELVPLTLAIVFGLPADDPRRRRLALGVAVPVLTYLLGGALVHADLLWSMRALGSETGLGVGELSRRALACSPLIGLPLLAGCSSLPRTERALALALAAFLVSSCVLWAAGLGDPSPLALALALPALGLVVGRQCSALAGRASTGFPVDGSDDSDDSDDQAPPADGGWGSIAGLTLVALVPLLAGLAARVELAPLLPLALITWALGFALARLLSPRWALVAWCLLALLTLSAGIEHSIELAPDRRLEKLEQWWRDLGPEPGAVVVTDHPLAETWLIHRGLVEADSDPPLYLWVRPGSLTALDLELPRRPGLRELLGVALREHEFGRPLARVPSPSNSDPGTVFILTDDGALAEELGVPLDRWRRSLDMEVDRGPSRLLIGRVPTPSSSPLPAATSNADANGVQE